MSRVSRWFQENLLFGRLIKKSNPDILYLNGEPAIGRFCIKVLKIDGKLCSLQLETQDRKGNVYCVHEPRWVGEGGSLSIEDYERAFEIHLHA